MSVPGLAGPTGRIEVRGLRVLGTHGVLPEERDRRQPFELDLDLELDPSAAAATDRLGDTVDYGAVVEAVAAVVGGPPAHDLLESLADRVAGTVLDLDDRLTGVTVTLRKLRPPLPADVASVGVRLTRSR